MGGASLLLPLGRLRLQLQPPPPPLLLQPQLPLRLLHLQLLLLLPILIQCPMIEATCSNCQYLGCGHYSIDDVMMVDCHFVKTWKYSLNEMGGLEKLALKCTDVGENLLLEVPLVDGDSAENVTSLSLLTCGQNFLTSQALGNLLHLKSLLLLGNGIKDRLPLFLPHLSLQELGVFQNPITTLCPGDLPLTLRSFQMKRTSLSYIHPETFFRVSNLTTLDLSVNDDLECLPTVLFARSNLHTLDISRCPISGLAFLIAFVIRKEASVKVYAPDAPIPCDCLWHTLMENTAQLRLISRCGDFETQHSPRISTNVETCAKANMTCDPPNGQTLAELCPQSGQLAESSPSYSPNKYNQARNGSRFDDNDNDNDNDDDDDRDDDGDEKDGDAEKKPVALVSELDPTSKNSARPSGVHYSGCYGGASVVLSGGFLLTFVAVRLRLEIV